MAKVIKSGLMPEFYGRIGNLVYVRGKYGMYVKEYTKPQDPKTTKQNKVRGLMMMLNFIWNSLSIEELEKWDNNVRNWRIRNKTNTGYLTAYQFFIKINMKMVKNGGNPMLICPDDEII